MQTAVVPDGLAGMPPGPALAAELAAVALDRVPNDQILPVLVAQYRQLCHEQARMAAVIAEVGRCAGYPAPGQVDRVDAPYRYAAQETRAALRWTRRSAEAEHHFAETVVHDLPAVHTAWLSGDIDRPRVRVFDRYLLGLTPAQVANICRVAVPRAPRLTTGQLAVLLARMVIAVDPDAAARWYRKGVRERNVFAYPDHDGTIRISANGLPADEAEAACIRLQDLAAAAKRAGHPGLIGQIRCDLFLGMLDGRFHHMNTAQVITALIADHRPTGPAADPGPGPGPDNGTGPDGGGPHNNGPDGGGGGPRGDNSGSDGGAGPDGGGGPDRGPDRGRPGQVAVPEDGRGLPTEIPVRDGRVGIEIRVGLATLLGRDEHPADIPGLGLLPAPDTRRRVALQRRAEWRFAVTDTHGQLLTEGCTPRRPGSAHRDGPPGGIVEVHIPLALLDELTGNPAACGEWVELVADIAEQHARRDTHLTDLDAHPGDRLPGAALRRHTEIRDRTCTFIGCRRRANATDQDHTLDHDHGGATVRVNLGPVCPHDHDVKHQGGWRVEQPEPGLFVWHSPLGGEYHTRGEFLLPPMPDPAPADLGPHFDAPGTVVEGPILSRPPPRPPPEPPPPPPDHPDEPPF